MPGPAPKPVLVKRREGNPAGKKLVDKEPKPPATIPSMPETVRRNPEAKQSWKRLVKTLTGMKVLTVADEDLLTRLCLVQAEIACLQELFWATLEISASKLGGDGDGNGHGIDATAIDTSTVEGRATMRAAIERAAQQADDKRQAFTQLYAARKLEAQYLRAFGLDPTSRTRVQTVEEKVEGDDPWGGFDAPDPAG